MVFECLLWARHLHCLSPLKPFHHQWGNKVGILRVVTEVIKGQSLGPGSPDKLLVLSKPKTSKKLKKIFIQCGHIWKRDKNIKWQPLQSIFRILAWGLGLSREPELCITNHSHQSCGPAHHCLGSSLSWEVFWQVLSELCEISVWH